MAAELVQRLHIRERGRGLLRGVVSSEWRLGVEEIGVEDVALDEWDGERVWRVAEQDMTFLVETCMDLRRK